MTFGSVMRWVLIDEDTHQRFFLCDCCAQRRRALVLENDRFICRATYRKSGEGGSQAIRSARFTMAVEDLLREHPRAQLRRPEGFPRYNYVPAPIETDIDPQIIKETYYSAKKAIELGRGASQYPIYDFYQELDRDYWETHDTAPDYVKPYSSSLTNALPRLDINDFRPRLLNDKGQLIARTLCWGDRAGAHDEVLFFVDWRAELPIVLVAYDFIHLERTKWQRLPLAQQVSGRFRWVCPVLSKKCDVLYLRNRLFASREAQWLYAPSQRALGRAQKRNG